MRILGFNRNSVTILSCKDISFIKEKFFQTLQDELKKAGKDLEFKFIGGNEFSLSFSKSLRSPQGKDGGLLIVDDLKSFLENEEDPNRQLRCVNEVQGKVIKVESIKPKPAWIVLFTSIETSQKDIYGRDVSVWDSNHFVNYYRRKSDLLEIEIDNVRFDEIYSKFTEGENSAVDVIGLNTEMSEVILADAKDTSKYYPDGHVSELMNKLKVDSVSAELNYGIILLKNAHKSCLESDSICLKDLEGIKKTIGEYEAFINSMEENYDSILDELRIVKDSLSNFSPQTDDEDDSSQSKQSEQYDIFSYEFDDEDDDLDKFLEEMIHKNGNNDGIEK